MASELDGSHGGRLHTRVLLDSNQTLQTQLLDFAEARPEILHFAWQPCGSLDFSRKINDRRGCSSMVELQLPKLLTWVRFPSPAPEFRKLLNLKSFALRSSSYGVAAGSPGTEAR